MDVPTPVQRQAVAILLLGFGIFSTIRGQAKGRSEASAGNPTGTPQHF
jgi:hypothetical protein